jgi:hypothetical protein
LPGIPPGYLHPHGRSYSLLSVLLKTAFCPMSGALSTGAGATRLHYTGLAMSEALNLIKIAPPRPLTLPIQRRRQSQVLTAKVPSDKGICRVADRDPERPGVRL